MLKPRPTPDPLPQYKFKSDPYFHQRHEFNASRDMDVRGLFWEVGCAKSKPMLDTACDLYARGKIDTLLILAPNKVHNQWIQKEVPAHVPERIDHVAAFYKSGIVNKPWHAAVANDTGALRILAVNTEAMSHAHLAKMVWGLCKDRKVMCVLDESHDIATPSSTRSRNIRKLRPLTDYRRILTGTETAGEYADLYAQMAFLDPAIIGCRTYTEFKTEYCILVGEYNEIVGYKNVEQLKRKLAPYISMWEKKDCLDLPEILPEKVHEVELTPEQWKVYKQVRDEYVTELSSGAIVEAPLMITRIQKLSQVAAGHIQTGGGQWEPLPCEPRMEIVLKILSQAQGQTIIWAEWQPDIVQVSNALTTAGVRHVTYYGGNSSSLNDKNLALFQQDPSVKVWLATPSSGGVGLTINEADTVIFYDLGNKFRKHAQARGRNHRPGQTKHVGYNTLIAPKTVEVKLRRMLAHKQEMQDLFRDPAVFKKWLLEEDEIEYEFELEF